MTKSLRSTILFASLALANVAAAQTASLFTTSVDLNIGNIVAPHLVHGDMWWTPATGTSPMQFPKGSSGRLGGVSGLYLAGLDPQATLIGAMQMYRNKGAEFWPGPIGSTPSDAVNNQQTADWAKIWRVDRSTIDAFRKMPSHTTSNTPAEILEWPGAGNIYAKGRSGASLTITTEMAPFVDLNSNGIYEPLSGEYPKIKGGQMLWWILNDNCQHMSSLTPSMKLEIKISAYAYATGSLTDNILFYEYDMTHGRNTPIMDFIFSPVTDLDLNYAFNDYTGFDSARRVAISYDESAYPAGIVHQAAGMVLLQQPGDSWTNYTPAGAMNYMRNGTTSPDSDPENALEAYRYMTGYDRLGNKRVPNSNYAISGLNTQCENKALPGDLRIVLATSPVRFAPQTSLHYAFALVAADSVGACPNTDFGRLLSTVDSAYSVYYNPPLAGPDSPTGVRGYQAGRLSIYPNPASNSVTIDGAKETDAVVRITNVLGATVSAPVTRTGNSRKIDVATLPSGMYYVEIIDGDMRFGGKFIKN